MAVGVALAEHLASVFAGELAEQLDAAAHLLPLLASPSPPAETRRHLARVFHTIKGGAGLVGRADLAAAAERLERVFAGPDAPAADGQAALDLLFAAAALPAPSLTGEPTPMPAPPLAQEMAVLVQSGTARLALPLRAIARAAVVSMHDVDWHADAPSIRVRGATLDAVILASLLDQPPPAERAIALSLAPARSVAILVDRISPPTEIARLPLAHWLAAHPILAGMAIDPTGSAVCVLDAERLAARTPAHDRVAVPQPAMPGKVLVVDDSKVIRDAIASLLGSAGIPCETAVDGCDALGKLATAPVAAVVTDVEMPRMDGFELVEALRADARWRSLPVLLCTSRAEGLEPDCLRALGVAGVVAKPFDEQTLLARLRRLLEAPGRDGML
jgi:CheY-like chemotaxis protein